MMTLSRESKITELNNFQSDHRIILMPRSQDRGFFFNNCTFAKIENRCRIEKLFLCCPQPQKLFVRLVWSSNLLAVHMNVIILKVLRVCQYVLQQNFFRAQTVQK